MTKGQVSSLPLIKHAICCSVESGQGPSGPDEVIESFRSANSTSMLSTKHREFRRPMVRPRRSTWPHRIAELCFGTLAKATMVIAALVVVALAALEGGVFFSDLPTTRRGWRNLFLIILVAVMIIAIGIYLVQP